MAARRKANVDEAAQGVMRELLRTCACCNEKNVCQKDFTERPDDPVLKSYCPNAVTLESLTELKARSST
jgi:hypothetical protein